MALPEHILLMYGYLLLFAWVLIEQMGIPLPATPVLLAAGALSAENEISFPLALLSSLVAALIADSVWFHIGRRYGHVVMRVLCKLSLEPTICVRRTQESYGRRRALTLMIAKFVPGLATLAPPVAGQNGMPYANFLLFDGIGATLWIGTLLVAGRLFGDLLHHDPRMLDWAGNFSAALLLAGILGFLVVRILRRRMVLKNLEKARLEPHELKRMLDAGEEVFIVDLRHPLELLPDPFTLPGALHLSPEQLSVRAHEIPRDRAVVLYCTCPSEATAAKTALTLHKLGIERVHPLRGGYDEWKRLGFPLDAVYPVQPVTLTTISSIGPVT
jgi:membrane protein DedA with SNARE-associated domain/rhodanese-related sulfurtransferase